MPVSSYHSLTCRQLARLLSTHGRQTSVQAADAACADDVRHVFGRHGPLRGVVHMASQSREQLVARESWAGVSSALGAKANGAWLNHAAACRLPSFQLLFSSIYSLGGHHLGAYAAANVLLNALAERGAAHGIAALALNLPPVRAVGIAAAAFGSLLDRGNSSVANLATETKQLTEYLADLLRPPIAPSYLLLPGEIAGAEALLGVVTTNRMLGQTLGWSAASKRLRQSTATPGIVRDTAASDTARLRRRGVEAPAPSGGAGAGAWLVTGGLGELNRLAAEMGCKGGGEGGNLPIFGQIVQARLPPIPARAPPRACKTSNRSNHVTPAGSRSTSLTGASGAQEGRDHHDRRRAAPACCLSARGLQRPLRGAA